MKIVYISIYCYKSFPVRTFHALSRKNGVDSYAIFFKNSEANQHKPIKNKEVKILLDLIKKINPDMIAFSVLAPYVVVARKLVHEIRKVSKASIIVGGKYADVSPEGVLEFADFACKGEGEPVLLDIFERFKVGKDFKNIHGLWWKDINGNIVEQGQRHLMQNLDELPFRSVGEPQMFFINNGCLMQEDPEIMDDVIWMMSGRGCVNQCSFCVNSLLIPMNRGKGKFVRVRTPDNVIEEIEYRIKTYMRAKSIFFVDEVFGVNYQWTREFHGKYLARNINMPFSIEMVPDLIQDRNIQLLAEIGLKSVQFGIQSGVDNVRNEIFNRPGTNSQILEKANILRKYNVEPNYDIILSNPFEHASDVEKTIKLLMSLPKPIKFNIYKLQFFPKYPLTIRALKQGLIAEEDVTDEKVAETVMKNYNFVPTVFSFKRKNYLESCIYILALSPHSINRPWIVKSGEYLARCLHKNKNLFLGIVANIIARIKYMINFNFFVSRIYAGLEHLMKGEIIVLIIRSVKMLKKLAIPVG